MNSGADHGQKVSKESQKKQRAHSSQVADEFRAETGMDQGGLYCRGGFVRFVDPVVDVPVIFPLPFGSCIEFLPAIHHPRPILASKVASLRL